MESKEAEEEAAECPEDPAVDDDKKQGGNSSSSATAAGAGTSTRGEECQLDLLLFTDCDSSRYSRSILRGTDRDFGGQK